MGNVELTNYEMNKQAYASENFKFNVEQIQQDIESAANNFYLENCKYVGLLCRERNDYTVFKLSNNLENFQNELKEVLYGRGTVLDVLYNRDFMGSTYQIGIKEFRSQFIEQLEEEFVYEGKPQVGMYMLFDATDGVVEVED